MRVPPVPYDSAAREGTWQLYPLRGEQRVTLSKDSGQSAVRAVRAVRACVRQGPLAVTGDSGAVPGLGDSKHMEKPTSTALAGRRLRGAAERAGWV